MTMRIPGLSSGTADPDGVVDITLTDLDTEIARTEREFSVMLEQLTGSASDMAGLAELKKLLGGM